jgi:hypothetical protein
VKKKNKSDVVNKKKIQRPGVFLENQGRKVNWALNPINFHTHLAHVQLLFTPNSGPIAQAQSVLGSRRIQGPI